MLLCEKKDHLGGALEVADTVDFKAKLKKLRESREAKLLHYGVEVRLNTPVTPGLARETRTHYACNKSRLGGGVKDIATPGLALPAWPDLD